MSVVPFKDCVVPTAIGEPVNDIVTLLETALKQAREGGLVGLGLAKVLATDPISATSFTFNFAHSAGQSRNLYAAIGELKFNYERKLFDL